ncbi:MAG: peptidyl-prolyl cis-trans isomerase [Firmicutes bacterium]|nr:peptidyl-prolyl cis-trans isomerase [Bacillota bacterium]
MAFKFIAEKEIAKVDEKKIEQYESNTQVILDTTMGSIVIELYQDKAPISVANFLDYLDSGFYNGTIFHRVIPNFMIQGGGFTEDMDEKKTGSPIKNEAGNGLPNLRGTIAMARTRIVDSATSQFFINTIDNFFLNHQDNSPDGYGYCVFGKVIEGMEVVDAIQNLPTGTYGYFEDVPLESVLIKTACRNNQSN